MILLLSDVHGFFDVVNVQIAHAEKRLGRPVDAVVILGDLGLFESDLARFFRKQGKRFARPVSFIEGNHEDFTHFSILAQRYADCLTHLPRGVVHRINGWRCLSLGGSSYMDAVLTPRHSVIEPADIRACLLHPPKAVEIVLSHDCPPGIGVPNTPGFEGYGPPGFPGGEQLLTHFAPRLWFFGHHHKWFERRVGPTRFHGLPQSWKGYALLDRRGRVRTVRHPIPCTEPLLRRLLRKIGL